MLSILDYLSPSPHFYINGKTRFQNNLGGFFTSGLVILSIIAFIHFSSKIIERLEPKVTLNQFYKTNGTELIINTSEPNGYQFYLVNGESSTTYENADKYFEILAGTVSWDYIDNQERVTDFKPIPLIKCQNSKVDSLCFAPGHIIKIQNAFIQFPYTFLMISVQQCINQTRSDCKPIEEIREKLKFSLLKVKVPTFYINSDNYTDPLIPYIKSTEAILTTQYTRRAYYLFKEVNYRSDDGYILKIQLITIK